MRSQTISIASAEMARANLCNFLLVWIEISHIHTVATTDMMQRATNASE